MAHVSESWRPRELFLFSFPAVFFLFDDFLPYFMVILFWKVSLSRVCNGGRSLTLAKLWLFLVFVFFFLSFFSLYNPHRKIHPFLFVLLIAKQPQVRSVVTRSFPIVWIPAAAASTAVVFEETWKTATTRDSSTRPNGRGWLPPAPISHPLQRQDLPTLPLLGRPSRRPLPKRRHRQP